MLGGGIKNPEDARTINNRARELGFSTSIGIIHDGSGRLKPLGAGRAQGLRRGVGGDQRAAGRSFKNLYSGIRSFQDNLADGKPNEWRCRAGARYLYICEDGLVHYCSQQRGYPGMPLETLHGRRHPARVRDAEVVRAVLHGRLRASRVDDGLLAKPQKSEVESKSESRRKSEHVRPDELTTRPRQLLFFFLSLRGLLRFSSGPSRSSPNRPRRTA